LACTTCTSPSDQFKCWLDELKIVYTDCDGNVHGDCGMCAGAGNSGTQTNTIAFNPGSNMITSIVDGIASSTSLTFDTGDITLAAALTINSTLYPVGTSLQTVLAAIVAFSHPAATVAALSNPALTINTSTQVLDLDLSASGSYDNSSSGLTADNIQDAIDELVVAATGLPAATSGYILMHNGTEFVPVKEVSEDITGVTTATFNVANAPLAFPPVPFVLLRNGIEISVPGDYTRTGQTVNLDSAAVAWEIFTATYYTL
jgi:hypothetical protein